MNVLKRVSLIAISPWSWSADMQSLRVDLIVVLLVQEIRA